MIKLKDILSESYAWERQEGKPLPTLAEVQAAYQAKLREDAGNEDPDEKGHVYEEPPGDDDDEFEDDGYVHEAEDKATKDYEYSLLKVKYIGRGDAKSSIKEIGIDAVTKNRVPGLLQFIPRYNTIIKVGSY